MVELSSDDLALDAAISTEAKKNSLSLVEVRNLCQQMAEQEELVENLAGQLKEAKEKLDKYSKETIPDALMQIGLKSMTLDDGTFIGIKEMVAAAISEKNKKAAHAWLRENNYGDLIKNEVTVVFGKDEDAQADKLAGIILAEQANGEIQGSLERQEKVHPQTLKAFVKERLKAGDEIPLDIFGIFTGDQAVIEWPKK